MIDYTEQTPEELDRLEAIAHAEGRTTEAALLDALAQVMRERDALQDAETLEQWEKRNGPAEEYKQFFHECFERLDSHYPAPSVTSDYDKSVIFEAIEKGESVESFNVEPRT